MVIKIKIEKFDDAAMICFKLTLWYSILYKFLTVEISSGIIFFFN